MKKKLVIMILSLYTITISLSACKNDEQMVTSEEKVSNQIVAEDVKETEESEESEETEETEQLGEIENEEEIETIKEEEQIEEQEKTGGIKQIEGQAEETKEANTTKEYVPEEHGFFQTREHEYVNENDEVLYSYEMECFHFYSEPHLEEAVLTMDNFYDEIEKSYQIEGDMKMEADFIARCREENGEIETEEEIPSPTGHDYGQLVFLGIKYVGEDYISVLYNNVSHMGGVHPYSLFEGVTIDCKTGKRLSISEMISEILKRNEQEVFEEVINKMGIESSDDTWECIDYYLTDNSVVFFYKMPGYWEDVVIER